MKKHLNSILLPLLTVGLGILGALLRGILFSSATDSRGLLQPFYPTQILLWLLTLGFAIFLIFHIRKLPQGAKYTFNFPLSPIHAIGNGASGLGFLFFSISLFASKTDTLSLLCATLGLGATIALIALGLYRWKGTRPTPVFSIILCIFFILRLISCYRLWSPNPQMEAYLFPLFANVFAMLSCYYDATFTDSAGNRARHTFFHLFAIYCAIVSLPECDNVIFYVTVCLFMLSNLCNLTPITSEKRKGI